MITRGYIVISFIVCVLSYVSVISSQQIISGLTIDFDQDDLDKVFVFPVRDIDGAGIFGVNNGSFEITDSEGNICPNPFPNTNGQNDNSAFIVSAPALASYCELSFTVEVSLSSAKFESCSSPGSLNPVGCTGFGVSEPGADGFVFSINHRGQEVLKGGYCGSSPEGAFRVEGLEASVGDVYSVMIMGGTQAPDESYFIERILVEGIAQLPIPPEIIGQTDYCMAQDAIVLNVIPLGGSNYMWTKDGIPLANDGNSSFVKELPIQSDAGLYQVDFILPGGCPASATLDIMVEQCMIADPIFNLNQHYCNNESLSLPIYSDNILSGSWNIPINLDLSNLSGLLEVVFTPDNGGVPYEDTLFVFQSFADTMRVALCETDFIEIYGSTYTVADEGSFGIAEFKTSDGCDSTIYIEIISISASYQLVEEEYCFDDTLRVNNRLYYSGSETGIDTLINRVGCDSLIERHYSFIKPEDSYVFGIYCPNDVIEVSGELFDIQRPNGVLILSSDQGCDSVVHIDLSFIESDSITIELSLCQEEIRTIRDIEIDWNFDPNLTFNFGPNGCDTMINFVVTQLESTQFDLTQSICPDDYIQVGNNNYDADRPSGREILIGSNGCDSLVSVDLTLLDVDTTVINESYCQADSFMMVINDVVYDSNNPFGQEVLVDMNGCDSVIVIDLDILTVLTGYEVYTGCQGDGYSVAVNGTIYDENFPQGTEYLTTSTACDSIVVVNLNYESQSVETVQYLGCTGDGYNIIVAGSIYDELRPDGVELLINSAGCDSVITIDLNFLDPLMTEIRYVGCMGDDYSIDVNGITYDYKNPNGIETLISSQGCDSIVTIDMVFYDDIHTLETYRACAGDGYHLILNGTRYDESNPIGQELLLSSNGCDSIIHISLEYEPIVRDTIRYLGCNNDGYLITVGTSVYDEDNPSGTELLQSVTGCDSMVIVELEYLDPIYDEITYSGCVGDGYNIDVNGVKYNERNPFGIQELTGVNGCDSIVLIDLMYQLVDTSYVDELICARNASSRLINGTVYNQSNPSGVEVFITADGCDSVVVVDLNFTEVMYYDLSDTLCFGASIEVDGTTYDKNNPVGTERILLANGCDSTINVALNFVDPVTFSYTLDTISTKQNYQIQISDIDLIETIHWLSPQLSCNNCTDPTINVSRNTEVNALISDIYGCTSTISIPIVINLELPNIYLPNVISISSLRGNDRIKPVVSNDISASYDMTIFDRWGGIIYEELQIDVHDNSAGWKGYTNQKYVDQGVYIYSITMYIAGLDAVRIVGTVMVL